MDFLPPGFDAFRCEYDLIGIEVGADNIGAMGQEAMESITTSPLMAALCGGGPSGIGATADPQSALDALLSDQAKRRAFGKAARRTVEQGYTYDLLANRLAEFLRALQQ